MHGRVPPRDHALRNERRPLVTGASSACSGCHGTDVNTVHGTYDDLTKCAICHSQPDNWSKNGDCDGCHSTTTPHPDQAAAHAATSMGAGDIVMGLNDSDHNGVSVNVDCGRCHYTDLAVQHASQCQFCHTALARRAAPGGQWNRSCQQGALSPDDPRGHTHDRRSLSAPTGTAHLRATYAMRAATPGPARATTAKHATRRVRPFPTAWRPRRSRTQSARTPAPRASPFPRSIWAVRASAQHALQAGSRCLADRDRRRGGAARSGTAIHTLSTTQPMSQAIRDPAVGHLHGRRTGTC